MKQKELSRTKLLGVFVLVFVVAAGLWFALSRSRQEKSFEPANETHLKELHLEDLRPGTGLSVKESSVVRVHYSKWIMAGGKLVDSSYARMVPVDWSMRDPKLLLGLKKGLLGMKKTGKRKIIIPPEYGYGARAEGIVPPNSHLVFEVEILDIQDVAPAPTLRRQSVEGASIPKKSRSESIKKKAKEGSVDQ